MRKFLKQKNEEDNLYVAIKNILSIIKVPVSDFSIENVLKNDPHYPSFLSVRHAFMTWNVNCLGVKIDINKLPTIPLPAIAHFHEGHNSFVVITEIENNKIKYIDSEMGKLITIGLIDFQERWSNNVMLVEKNVCSGENNYVSNNKRNRNKKLIDIILTILTIFMLILVFF